MDAYRWSPVYLTVFWGSFGTCLIALFTKHLRTRIADQLFVLTVVFLFANALTTGAMSMVNDRYQARAAWLMTLCLAAYVISWFGTGFVSKRLLDWLPKTLLRLRKPS